MRPSHVPGIQIAIVVEVYQMIVTVGDAVERPRRFRVVPSAVGLETEISPVQIKPGCDFVAFAVSAR